jgi:hypothetical protein
MSLKTENSRRVAKSRPVCMGLNALPTALTGRSRPILFLKGIYAVTLKVILEIFFLFRS